MMMTVMRVTISRRDTTDTTITDDVSLFSITDVGNSCVPQLPEIVMNNYGCLGYLFMITYYTLSCSMN